MALEPHLSKQENSDRITRKEFFSSVGRAALGAGSRRTLPRRTSGCSGFSHRRPFCGKPPSHSVEFSHRQAIRSPHQRIRALRVCEGEHALILNTKTSLLPIAAMNMQFMIKDSKKYVATGLWVYPTYGLSYSTWAHTRARNTESHPSRPKPRRNPRKAGENSLRAEI